MKIKFHLSPEPAPGGGTTEGGIVSEVATSAATPATTQAPAPAQTTVTETKEEKKSVNTGAFHDPAKILSEAKSLGDIPDGTTLEDVVSGKVEGIKEEKKEEKKDVPKTEKKDDEDTDFRFKIEDDETKEGATTIEEEPTWSGIAKEFDLPELETDDFDTFKSKISEKIAAERQAAIEEGKKLELEKLPEDARKLYDYLSVEGNTIETFLDPLKMYDEFLSMSNRDLVKKDFLLKKHPEEEAEEFVEELELDGKLDLRAKEFRRLLQNAKESKKEALVQEARNKIKAEADKKESARIAEFENFKKSLGQASEFFKVPIGEREKSMLSKKYEKGVYRAMLNKDPDLEVQVAMFIEFKDQLASLMGNGLRAEGRAQILDKIHNIGLPSGSKQIVSKNNLNSLDAWEEAYKAEKS